MNQSTNQLAKKNTNSQAPIMAPTIGATTGIQASPQRDGALVRDRQDGVQQTRHEVAGRVQARAGRAAHGSHETPHNEADDDGGGGVILLAPSQGQAAQGAEDEHQGAEHLVEEVVGLLVVRVSGAEGARIASASSVSL